MAHRNKLLSIISYLPLCCLLMNAACSSLGASTDPLDTPYAPESTQRVLRAVDSAGTLEQERLIAFIGYVREAESAYGSQMRESWADRPYSPPFHGATYRQLLAQSDARQIQDQAYGAAQRRRLATFDSLVKAQHADPRDSLRFATPSTQKQRQRR